MTLNAVYVQQLKTFTSSCGCRRLLDVINPLPMGVAREQRALLSFRCVPTTVAEVVRHGGRQKCDPNMSENRVWTTATFTETCSPTAKVFLR